MKTEDELTEQEKQEAALPVCPYCGQDPAILTMKQFMLGTAKTALIICGNLECRRILTVQILKIEEPRVVPLDSKLLIRPS